MLPRAHRAALLLSLQDPTVRVDDGVKLDESNLVKQVILVMYRSSFDRDFQHSIAFCDRYSPGEG